MAAGIRIPILIVIGPEDIEYDTHVGDVGARQVLEFITLFGDELGEIVIEEHEEILSEIECRSTLWCATLSILGRRDWGGHLDAMACVSIYTMPFRS
ncbi:MAG: hypothetical protein MK538_18170 [Planctomycetes bacterium]|nr:hypothetical protein [Planctomycetota bacterium]